MPKIAKFLEWLREAVKSFPAPTALIEQKGLAMPVSIPAKPPAAKPAVAKPPPTPRTKPVPAARSKAATRARR